MMKRVWLWAIVFCAAHGALAAPVNSNYVYAVYTNAVPGYTNFSWVWRRYADQKITLVSTLPGISSVWFRMVSPAGGTVWLTVYDGITHAYPTGTVWVTEVPKEAVPRPRTYWAEFVGCDGTNLTNSTCNTLASGMIRVEWSSFDPPPPTNAINVYINPFTLTNIVEYDPIWASASNLYLRTNDAWDTYYPRSNPSNYIDAAIATSIVNSLAFPLASGVDLSNRVVTLESWGNHATNNYAVNGDNISGNWFPVNNLKFFDTAFIGGGQGNVAASDYSVVVGGQSNIVHMLGPPHPNQWFSTIGGGTRNFARGRANVIAGGEANVITSLFFVAHNVIGGGLNNKIDDANKAAVLGGQNNTIYSDHGAIIGGNDNIVSGWNGVVLGGAYNIAGAYSIAAGIGALATNPGSMVISLPGTTNATFSSIGDNTFNVRAVGGIYFLSPTLFIQDTNGNTVAYFSATGSTINGSLNLLSYVTTGAHAVAINTLTTGKQDLAAAIAWSNAHHSRLVVLETGALTKVQAALTYATTGALVAVSNALSGRIAVLETGALTKVEAAVTYATTGSLAAAVNGLNNDLAAASNALRNSIGLTITNYTLADAALSNSLASVWTYASNTHAKTWSAYPATQVVDFANNSMKNVQAIYFGDWTVDQTNAPNLYMSMFGTNYYLYVRRGIWDPPRFVWHQGNFNPFAYQTIAAYNTSLTSTLWRWSGFVYPTSPTNPPGARGRMFESNGWLYVWSDASNAWGRVQLDFNW